VEQRKEGGGEIRPSYAFGLVMSAHVQALTLLVGAWYGAKWLNKEIPLGQGDWIYYLLPLALVASLYKLYLVGKLLIRSDDNARRRRSSSESDSVDNGGGK
jgi:hypothetical protein